MRKGEDGYTALIHASYHDHLSIVQELISHGADVNIKNKGGHTAYDKTPNPAIRNLLRPLIVIPEVIPEAIPEESK